MLSRTFPCGRSESGGSGRFPDSGPADPCRVASAFRAHGGSDPRRGGCVPALDRGRLAGPEAASRSRRARGREHLDLAAERGARDRRRQQPPRRGARPRCRGRARAHLRREPALADGRSRRRRGPRARHGDAGARHARRRPRRSARRLSPPRCTRRCRRSGRDRAARPVTGCTVAGRAASDRRSVGAEESRRRPQLPPRLRPSRRLLHSLRRSPC